MTSEKEKGIALIDSAIAALQSGPQSMYQEKKTIIRPIYSKVEGEVFHNFIQVCTFEGKTIGDKMAELVEEYSRKEFAGKKPYDIRYDIMNGNRRE
jgi:hypothetical protein